ncbi:MAG: amino acid transporter substrate-binding protein [Caulobacter sp.]|nr:amino acid transporter substrate-binding protein [Caulobacter sp.]
MAPIKPWAFRVMRVSGLAAVMLAFSALSACGPSAPAAPEAAAPPVRAAADDTVPLKATASPTLAALKARGRLNCGVNSGLAGFAFQDERGQWRGFDVDFCRALAAATLGKADAVNFVPLGNAERIGALKSGRVDVLSRNTSWTFTRDAGQGVEFAGVSYYDGQGFLARKALNLQSAAELHGAKICVQSGSTSKANLDDYFRGHGAYTAVVFPSADEARAAYEREACDALTADISALAAARSLLANPTEHEILPDVISKEALGPVVRQDDTAWTDIVRWTLNALILAEEHGVTSKTAEADRKASASGEVRRLLGAEPGYGALLGLDDAWAFNAVRQVGNYGEIFDRNLGMPSALRLRRGQNALWNATPPGLHYAPPFR